MQNGLILKTEDRRIRMTKIWMKAEHRNWSLINVADWDFTKWVIDEKGLMEITISCVFAPVFFPNGEFGPDGKKTIMRQLTDQEAEKLDRLIQKVRDWLPEMNQPDFEESQIVCDGSVFSLRVNSGRSSRFSFSFEDIYIYDFAAPQRLLRFLESFEEEKV